MATLDETNARLRAVPTAGAGLVRLELLGIEGEEAGRARFEQLVTTMVREMYPSARAVKANPGDWGIDTFVGELSRGTIAVWQSKYFVDGVDKAQQNQILDSFKSIQKAAEKHGFKVASWALALPVDMDGPATKWWDGWKLRNQRTTGIEIGLLPKAHIEGLLLKPDLAAVRQQYFGLAPGEGTIERGVIDPDDWSNFDNALFIKQLHVAGITTDRVARHAFFNAEVMTRDVQEREVQTELDALAAVRASLHQMWHTRFEAQKAECEETTPHLPRLYPDVMTAVESHHHSKPSPALRDTLVHRTGLVHHLVEAGHAGWVRNFEDVARDHRGDENE